jgi:hypothetical protein
MHDLRHVFATAALEAGVALHAIAPLLGHKNTAMTKIYAYLSDEGLRAATEKAAAQAGQLPAPTIDATANGRELQVLDDTGEVDANMIPPGRV